MRGSKGHHSKVNKKRSKSKKHVKGAVVDKCSKEFKRIELEERARKQEPRLPKDRKLDGLDPRV